MDPDCYPKDIYVALMEAKQITYDPVHSMSKIKKTSSHSTRYVV